MPLNDADRPAIIASLVAARAEVDKIKVDAANLVVAADKISAELNKILQKIRD